MKSRRPPVSVPRDSLTLPLRQAARSWPDKTALIEPETGGRAWSFGELDEASSRLAGALAAAGVAPGERVGLCLPNGAAYVLAFYGILKAGAVVVPLSTHYGQSELTHALALSGAQGLVAEARLWREAAPPQAGGPRLKVAVGQPVPPGILDFASLLGGPPGPDLSLGIDPQATLAVLPFSSGTTGLPKAVMLSHANLL
ncbi:MAG: acyl--CoA ligase, partial [Desulfarculus sp.]|nr:acyl--CoA ligase [Desulfarculus sp.]